jgi:hypothetical protein
MLGLALRFDGSNDRVSATNPTSLNVTGAFTIGAWVRPESISGSRYIIIKGRSSSGQYAYALRAADAKAQYRWISPTGAEAKFGTTTNVLAVGRWTHIAAAHTPGSPPQLFINGAAVPGSLASGSATALVGVSTNPFTVGSSSDGGEWFQGLIDEVFVCRSALTAADVRNLMNGQPIGSGSSPTNPPLLPAPIETTTPITAELRVTGEAAIVSWTAVPGAVYRVQYKNNLGDPEWQDLIGDIYAYDEVMRIEDFLDGQPQRFYQVVQQR